MHGGLRACGALYCSVLLCIAPLRFPSFGTKLYPRYRWNDGPRDYPWVKNSRLVPWRFIFKFNVLFVQLIMYCSVLLCIALYCSVLLCIALYCTVCCRGQTTKKILACITLYWGCLPASVRTLTANTHIGHQYTQYAS